MCPPDRTTLYNFYQSAKGNEWTKDSKRGDQYALPCSWYGIVCNDNGLVKELNLTNNGLSGTLNQELGNLTSLQLLDLSDNDVKGAVPSSIGSLVHLKTLRLSYNHFTGSMPESLEHLNHLELLHFHGNRLTGSMPTVNVQGLTEVSSFITDCGVPSDFDEPLSCPNCTMCCNSAGECESTALPKLLQVNEYGFHSYAEFTLVFLLSLTGIVCLVVSLSSLHDSLQKPSTRRLSIIQLDKKYALDNIGAASVYSFFLSKSWCAWSVALLVMTMQVWVLSMFVNAAMVVFSDDNSDFVYSWRCPRNDTTCTNTQDQDWRGWCVFSILMISHLMKDLLNGSKLLVLSARQRHSCYSRCRFFIGGLGLILVTAYAVYASAV
jgi:hypothetical protein